MGNVPETAAAPENVGLKSQMNYVCKCNIMLITIMKIMEHGPLEIYHQGITQDNLISFDDQN